MSTTIYIEEIVLIEVLGIPVFRKDNPMKLAAELGERLRIEENRISSAQRLSNS